MFLTETNVLETAKKQYHYKLKSYTGLFITMMIVQFIALLFSLGGVGSAGMGSGSVMLSVKSFSSEIIIIFTFFWAFIVAAMLTTKEYRNIDFAFVTNRVSANLSNIGFLVTTCLLGGLSAILGGVLLRVLVYYIFGSANILSVNFFIVPRELLLGIAVTVLYLLLLSAIGYFAGMLVQFSKVFLVILPTLFFGTLILTARNPIPVVVNAMNFLLNESSPALLAVKVIFIASGIFVSTILLSNRLEVRE